MSKQWGWWKLYVFVKKTYIFLFNKNLHIFVKQKVCPFFLFRNSTRPLLGTFSQMNLVNVMSSLAVTTNSGARTDLMGFMREVRETVRFLAVRFSNDYLFSTARKHLCNHLIDYAFSASFVPLDVQWAIWTWFTCASKENASSSVFQVLIYKVQSETLSVNVSLDRKRIFVS